MQRRYCVGIVHHGDREARKVPLSEGRFAGAAKALEDVGIETVSCIYNDDFAHEFLTQASELDGLLVWINPIMADQHDRTKLDAALRDLDSRGVVVSAHPDTIMRMGTKQVLFDLKDISCGSDVRVYHDMEDFRRRLPDSLDCGRARVLKQYRGHSGGGIWKIQLLDSTPRWSADTLVKIRHAERGCVEQVATLEDVFELLEGFFQGDGRIIDQPYQERLTDGMIRCYLVVDKIEGFGHQAINALYPAPPGAPPEEAPQPGPRLYHPADTRGFQSIKKKMEEQYLPEILATLKLDRAQLPLLWDADFFFGPPDDNGQETYVLCEINVSSVSPFPESAQGPLARATLERLQERSQKP